MSALTPARRLVIALSAAACLATAPLSAGPAPQAPRPRIGVALGGGSARGIAHVGVLRWLEEHHIPVDVVSGTSMGGLIGGSYATGMDPDELEQLLAGIDWDAMFGSSSFQFQNVRRKRDSRSYPSHLEFGLKGGLTAPPSLNGGQQVDLLLERIAAPYYGITSFDDLPTPFRSVALDLRTARRVVLDRGSLAMAMRATMSLPAVFPPVQDGDRVLVDGGTVDNVPADVARDMGAAHVIAVNVGDLSNPEHINLSLLGIAGTTIDAMMRANTERAVAAADVIIDVPLEKYGSLDWRRYRALIHEGYQAAEAMKDKLLPYAVDQAAWDEWQAARRAARKTVLPTPAFVEVTGAGKADTRVMQRRLGELVGRPLDIAAVDRAITALGGLARYESLNWRIVEKDGAVGLAVDAHPKPYGPPFLLLGASLENTSSNDFRFGIGGRYLSYDRVGSGSELRVDATVGSDPALGLSLYKPLGASRLFVEPLAGISSQTQNVISDGRTVASYRLTTTGVGIDGGVNISRLDEVRAGLRWGHSNASVQIGDPMLPEVGGQQSSFLAQWTHDGQDSVIVGRGIFANAVISHRLQSPDPPQGLEDPTRTSDGLTQAVAGVNWVHGVGRGGRHRLFLSGSGGTSFSGHPLPSDQFALGGPLNLGALQAGALRGDHYLLATSGYLHRVFRMPDFLGGPVYAGGWLEVGSAFDHLRDATADVDFSVGTIADTLIGPIFLGASVDTDGESRFYIAIGKVFR